MTFGYLSFLYLGGSVLETASKKHKGKSGIYIITNLVNGKVYIGQSIDLWIRINEGHVQKLRKNKGHNKHLQRAWNKYSERNFKFEILELVGNYDDLNERETHWINFYNATDKSLGYNLEPIGGSSRGRIASDEERLKKSLAFRGEKNPNYGKPISDEQKQILSKIRSVPIVQLDLQGNFIKEWESIKIAASYFGITPSPIQSALKKKTTQSCGFIWAYKDEYVNLKFNLKDQKKNIQKRSVVQLTSEGKYLKQYMSITDAKKETKISNIATACSGMQKTAGGFVWMYYEDYILKGFDIKNYSKSTRKVSQFTMDGELIKIWSSCREVADNTPYEYNNIYLCCKGKTNKHGNYFWIYDDEYSKDTNTLQHRINKENKIPYNCKSVVQLSLNGEHIRTFQSVKEAHKHTNVIASNISANCKGKIKTAGGYIWIHEDEYYLIK